jgi:hypothetical protein
MSDNVLRKKNVCLLVFVIHKRKITLFYLLSKIPYMGGWYLSHLITHFFTIDIHVLPQTRIRLNEKNIVRMKKCICRKRAAMTWHR